MKRLYTYLVYGVILSVILLEGLSLHHGQEYSYTLLLILPLLIVWPLYRKNRAGSLKVPKCYLLLCLSIVGWIAFSSIFSLFPERSIYMSMAVVGSFVISLLVYHTKKTVLSYFVPTIVGLTVFFAIVTLLVRDIDFRTSEIFEARGYQFISAVDLSYQPIANLLVLTLIIVTFYTLRKSFRYVFVLMPLLLAFLLTYMRASFFAYTVTTITMLGFEWKKISGTMKLLSILTAFMVLGAGIFISVGLSHQPLHTPERANIQFHITNSLGYQPKSFTGQRQEYILQGFTAISVRPLSGTGLGNFFLASEAFATSKKDLADTSFNIIIDAGAETGIIGMILVFTLGWYLGKQAILPIIRGNKDDLKVPAYIVLSMAALYMFGDIFRSYSFMLLTAVAVGLVLPTQEKSLHIPVRTLFLTSLVLGIISLYFFLSFLSTHQSFIL